MLPQLWVPTFLRPFGVHWRGHSKHPLWSGEKIKLALRLLRLAQELFFENWGRRSGVSGRGRARWPPSFFFCGEKLEVDSKSKTSLIALNRFHRHKRRFDPPIIPFFQRAFQGRGKPQEIQRTSQRNKQRRKRRNFRRHRKITVTCNQIQGGDAYSTATKRTKEGQGKKIAAIFS